MYMQETIDYSKIEEAIRYYSNQGFKYIEVPWIVSLASIERTLPPSRKSTDSFLGSHVASAEQSFIEMIQNGTLSPGKYVSCTPCFRDDLVDETHHKWFIKVELLDFDAFNELGAEITNSRLKDLITTAKTFFEKYTSVDIIDTEIGFDLFASSVELGSYGLRKFNDFSFIYGTGIAEPRLSHVLNKRKKGYHLTDIPRGVIGYPSKIREELLEFEDSLKQSNPLMALQELSDLIGAIESYVTKHYSGKILFEDILSMKQVTRRAFENGQRS